MPENVSLNVRAIVTTGFAKLVEALNQYAAVMYIATNFGTASILCFTPNNIVSKRPKVAITSEKYREKIFLTVVYLQYGKLILKWAATVPNIPAKI